MSHFERLTALLENAPREDDSILTSEVAGLYAECKKSWVEGRGLLAVPPRVRTFLLDAFLITHHANYLVVFSFYIIILWHFHFPT